jgi:hypothetical protein
VTLPDHPRLDALEVDRARGSVPELQQLARTVAGEPRAVLRRLLLLVCEQLGMDAAVLCTVEPGGAQRTVRMALQADGTVVPDVEGRTAPLAQTWCGHVVEADLLFVGDVQLRPELQGLAATADHRIRSYAGVALRDGDGRVVGTLAAHGHDRHQSLNARDGEVLRGLGEVVVPLLGAPERAEPARRRTPDLSAIADAVGGARSVEDLSRPLLDALHDLTGLASSYLTVIDEGRDVQEIRYSHNTREGFALPEGLHVPWGDTLCKRALDEGRPCTTDVPDVWGDSDAAADLGIQVYVSVPVSLSDGRVWVTGAGGSDRARARRAGARRGRHRPADALRDPTGGGALAQRAAAGLPRRRGGARGLRRRRLLQGRQRRPRARRRRRGARGGGPADARGGAAR